MAKKIGAHRKTRTWKIQDEDVIFTLRFSHNDWWRTAGLIILVAFLAGLGSGYLAWGRSELYAAQGTETASPDEHAAHIMALGKEVNPPEGYTLDITYGDVGPKLLAAGAINHDAFVQLYEQANRPLDENQQEVLDRGSDSPIVLNKQNAHFLLNLFWALGLANKNPILTDGPMMQGGIDQLGRFASTGGWTLAMKPLAEVYAGREILSLTPDQQARLEEVAKNVYRPCCSNPTYFPDCNHGMAMLGLLELMASQGATQEEMYTAAKYANAYWYPNQYIELAEYLQANDLDFSEMSGREVVSKQLSSAAGYRTIHQWLSDNNLLPNSSGG